MIHFTKQWLILKTMCKITSCDWKMTLSYTSKCSLKALQHLRSCRQLVSCSVSLQCGTIRGYYGDKLWLSLSRNVRVCGVSVYNQLLIDISSVSKGTQIKQSITCDVSACDWLPPYKLKLASDLDILTQVNFVDVI